MFHLKNLFLYVLLTLPLISCGGGGSSSNSAPDVSLDSITLNSLTKNLKLNETFQLIATGSFSDASSSDISDQVSWVSSDSTVISVSSLGLITAVSAGTASITATLDAQSANTSATAIALVEISISPTLVTLAINSSQDFMLTGRYSDNSTENLTSSSTWSTNDSAIATITTAGKLTAVSAGASQVTASVNANALSNAISVTVSAATLQKIDIIASSTLVAGVSEQLSAIGTFTDGSTQDITSDLNWQSNASSIASVDAQTALLTTIQQGDVVITASNGVVSDTVNLTVSPATLSSLSVTPSAITLSKGSTKTVTVTAFYSDQSFIDVSNQVSWLASDDVIAGAQVNTALIEAKAVGSNILTASFSGMSTTLNVNVSNATLNSLSILPKSASLPKGLNQNFSATGLYSDGTAQDLTQQVTWISSDSSLGSISNAADSIGSANAINIGTVTISAALEGINTATTLTIKDAQLSSIEITPSNLQVANGVSVQASAIGSYSDGSKIDITQLVQWESTNINIAKLSDSTKGLIETLNSGQALISANLNNVSALSQIDVSVATLQTININASVQTLAKGTEMLLTATGVYSDNSTNDISHQVTWTSSDDSVLTVENANSTQNTVGLARATNIGNATVNVTFNGIAANIVLTVSDAVLTEIAITSVNSEININSTTQASAIATFSDASTVDITQQVNWLSSNPSVASVNQLQDNGGLVKAIAQGGFLLSASLNGVASNSLSINVNSNPNAPSSMTLSLTPNVILRNGTDSSKIQVTLIPESAGGVIADGSSVSFDIVEGPNTRTEIATTLNGVATLNLTSTFDGLISIKASFNADVSAQAGMLSTLDFANVIVPEGRSNAVFVNDTLLKDSVFLVLIRNISNREFNIPAIFITSGPDTAQVSLPGTPVTDLQFTNGGVLLGGAYAALGYSLDSDVAGNILRMIYGFTDSITGVNFVNGIVFTF